MTGPREIHDGLVIDPRRVLWLPEHGTLAAADLHLGYVWAHRYAGQLMPISTPEDTAARLGALAQEYGASQVVLLGDIIHRAASGEGLLREVRELAARLAGRTIRWVAGNHDRNLVRVLEQCGVAAGIEAELRLGPHLLLHGAEDAAEAADPADGWLVMGHEHPAIRLGDGVTTSLKCHCFLIAERVLVLPAFSSWAAGCDIRSRRMMSPVAQRTGFTLAYAILGERLLGIPL